MKLVKPFIGLLYIAVYSRPVFRQRPRGWLALACLLAMGLAVLCPCIYTLGYIVLTNSYQYCLQIILTIGIQHHTNI